MQVRIYKSIKNPMQSGVSKKLWILEHKDREKDRFLEPLMSRTSSRNMSGEIKLEFTKLEEAISFAEQNNYIYEVTPPKTPQIIKKNYAANFK